MKVKRTPLPEYIRSLPGTELPNGYVISEDDNKKDGPTWHREGASAYVLKATGPLGSPKAIKILRREKVEDKLARSRFLGEVKKLQSVRHPNIVSVEDSGLLPVTDSGRHYKLPYYVMEFVDGAQIDKWASQKEAAHEYLEVGAVCSLIRQVVTALAHVHS